MSDTLIWSNGYSTNSFGFFTFYGNYMYFPNRSYGSISQTNLDGSIYNFYFSTGLAPGGCLAYNGYLYISNFNGGPGDGVITKISLSDNVKINTWATTGSGPTAIVTDGTYLYISCYYDNKISRILISNPNIINNNFITGISNVRGLAISGGNIYIAADSISGIYKASLMNPSNITLWATIPGTAYGLEIFDSYIYASSPDNNIYKISLTIPTSQVIWKTNTYGFRGILYYNNYLYAFTNLNGSIAQYYLEQPIPPAVISSPPCFKKDTKILTDKGYIPIQYLRKGDLVKTFRNEYKAVEMIGKKMLTHDASIERNKKQLFVYRSDQYPEIMEDLVITGCHSILVERFSCDQQREKTIETNGDIYVTDKRYRLPAVADEKAMIFEASGDYMIYHFALENEDYYMNYGIYANGLLVETCSKRYLKECSDMTLIGV